jgi:VanZ family protein
MHAYRWSVWTAYLVLLTGILVMPMPSIPDDASSLRQGHFFMSKITHVASYAVFVLLSAWVRAPIRFRPILLMVVSLHAFAGEFLQQFSPTRFPSLRDVVFDHVGILLGAILTWRHWLEGFSLRRAA